MLVNKRLKLTNFQIFGRTPGWGGPYGPPKIKKIFFLYFLSSPIPIFSGKTFIFSNRCIKIGFPTLSLKKKFNIRWGQMSGSIISCHIYIYLYIYIYYPIAIKFTLNDYYHIQDITASHSLGLSTGPTMNECERSDLGAPGSSVLY